MLKRREFLAPEGDYLIDFLPDNSSLAQHDTHTGRKITREPVALRRTLRGNWRLLGTSMKSGVSARIQG